MQNGPVHNARVDDKRVKALSGRVRLFIGDMRSINALISTVTVDGRAPIIAASKLRKGSTGSPKGASRLVADTLATVRRLRGKGATGRVLLRADSTFYGQPVVHAAQLAGVDQRTAGPPRQGCDRLHRRRRVDTDPVLASGVPRLERGRPPTP